MDEQLKVIIQAELAQFRKAMDEAIGKLKAVGRESKKASNDLDGFTAELNQQRTALSDLKKKYVDLAAAQGKESKAAKDVAEEIKRVSAAFRDNKKLATDLAKEADGFDLSLGDSNDVDDTNNSVQDLQGSLEAIKNLDMASVFWSMFGPDVKKHLDNAVSWFKDAADYASYARASLSKKSWYYNDSGVEWEGFGGAMSNWKANMNEALYSSKKGWENVGKAGKEAMANIGKALQGVVGVLLVLIADLLIVIGLVKNALNTAKEIKQLATDASKAGMDVNTYSEWGYVLKQVGVESDKLTDFTKKLIEKQNELREGSDEVAKSFEKIGISQEEVMGSSQEELFRKTVEGLQSIENVSQRTSLAYEIFTDDAKDLMNVLYLTNQETQSLIDNYYTLGAAPSDNLVQKSQILEGSVYNLKLAWSGLGNTLAEWVMPAVISVIQALTTAIAWLGILFKGIFGIEFGSKKAGETAESSGKKISNGYKQATKSAKELLRTTMGFDELNIMPKSSTGSGSDSAGGNGYGATGINPNIPVVEVPDLSGFQAWFEKYRTIIQDVATWSLIGIGVLLAVLGFMGGNIPLALIGISLAGLGIGVGAVEGGTWERVGQTLKSWFESIAKWFNEKVKPVFTAEYWKNLWNNIKTAAAEKLAEIKAKIDQGIAPIKKWLVEKVKPIFTKDYWKNLWNNIKQAASDKLTELKQKIDEKTKPIRDWFENKIKPIFTKKYWTDLLKGMKEGFRTGLNDCIANIEKFINNIAKKLGLGKVQQALSAIGIDFNLSEIHIPRLESGGIATHSILANIGERGKEAVLPLENHTEWMDILEAKINKNTPTKLYLVVDGKELGYTTINSINSITKQTGQLQLQLI